ncbi:MAG TPA: FlgD immunoglobulin-like domain containing protein [Candidatus Kapabacteria bacterium]|nr:FlgD immunoglobulin-like domain containing protein [Candidatus Kapabacteria bacterium]
MVRIFKIVSNTLLCAALVAPVLLAPARAHAQSLKPGEWKTYTSMRSVTDVALASDSLHAWAATGGGAFEVDLRDAQTAPVALRATDGLSENDLTAVASDSLGNIYFGGGGGGFDVYNTATGKIVQLGNDIVNSPFTIKSINAITVYGDKIYLATAYGITVFLSRGAFGATVSQIAGLQSQDSVRQILDDGTHVYGAMHEGVVFANGNTTAYLQDGHNWLLLPDAGGSVRALANFHGTIYAGAENGLFAVSISQDSLVSVPIPYSIAIERMIVANDSLYLLDNSGTLYSTRDLSHFAVQALTAQAGSTVTSIAPDHNGGIVMGSDTNGVAFPAADSLYANLFPPGPISNEINGLSFAPSTDKLYVTNLNAGFGIFSPETEAWQNFQSGVGGTPAATYVKVFYDSIRSTLWLSTYGSSLFHVQGIGSGQPQWKSFDDTQIPNWDRTPSTWILTSGMMLDQAGNFVVTDWAGNGKGLCISADGKNFTKYLLDPAGQLSWGCVTQDQNGNYWIGTETGPLEKPDGVGKGVYWLRSSDGAYGVIAGGISGSLGTPTAGTEFVNAILTDQDDGIWCGTNAGVEIISNPEAIQEPGPVFSIRSVPFLANQTVHAMATDGVGNKWIGTDNGIFVVSPDGSDSVARFTKENSPLVDDRIASLTIDPTRGEAYAGTPSGISRFSTIFKQGKPDYTSIRVYPNPVVQSAEVGGSPEIYIDGLVAGSTVQIFSLAGQLITTIDGTALGSTVTWNGRDALGRQVPSGMYLVSATSAQSGENGEAKVVIVRKP